jgi:hypothetical protein
MIRYLVVLLQVLAYMVVRIRLGFRLSYHEKNQFLEGFLKLGQKFIEDYRGDEATAELGSSRVDILTRYNIRLPALPET